MKRAIKRKAMAGVTAHIAATLGTLSLAAVWAPATVLYWEHARSGALAIVCMISGLAFVVAQAQIDRGTWRSAAVFGGAVGVTAALAAVFGVAMADQQPVAARALEVACAAAGVWAGLACVAAWVKARSALTPRSV